MPITADFSKRETTALRREFFRDKLITIDPNLANDPTLHYGNAAEEKFYELGVDAMNETLLCVDIPPGTTNMKMLNPALDYYASTAEFASFTTDRPTGATGAYFITHSRIRSDSCIQTITRNTAGTSVEYWRVLYASNDTASTWHQRTITAVAYSAT